MNDYQYTTTGALVLATLIAVCLPTTLGAQPVTFNRDVAPILYDRCALCHRPNDVAPMSLLTWDEVRPWAKSIAQQVASKRMPPFHADPGDYAFANDTSLSDEHIETITQWVDQGASQGELGDLPPPPNFESLSAQHRLGPPDRLLQAENGFTLAPGSDLQRAFVIRNPFDEDVWLSAIDYDTRSPVVHHLLAVTDPTGDATGFELEDQQPGFAVSLTGGAGSDRMMKLYMNGASFLGSWAPGWVARKLGDDIGIRLRKGHDIVLQIHYWNGTDEPVEHRPQVGLYFNKEKVRHVLRSGGPAADPEIFIAAGDANAEHEDVWIAPQDLHVYSASPHMHFLGKSMHLTAEFPNGSEKVLLDVPRFRFEWQATYAYEEPVFLPKGTRVRMVSVHDNSIGNPDNPTRPPRDVTFGERSTDEMAECILAYTFVEETGTQVTRTEVERLEEYLAILGDSPNDSRLRLQVGRILASEGRDDEALVHFRAATQLVPGFLPAGQTLASTLERTGDLEGAAAELERLIDVAPGASNILLQLARVEEARGRSASALGHYLSVVRAETGESANVGGNLEPAQLGEAHFRAGTLLADQGEAQRAIERFRTATELVPSMAEAHLNLAILHGRNGNYRESASHYAQVIELDPGNLQVRISQIVALLLSDQDRAAVDQVRAGLARHADSIGLGHLLARILATSKDDGVRDGPRALELAQQIFEAQPSPDHAETMAMALAEAGRYEDAAQVQRQLVSGMENAGREDLLSAARQRLFAYENREPCRSPWLD